MHFKQGLRDTALFHKLTWKDIKRYKQLFDIANHFAKAEEAISETRERKRDGKRSHHDQAESPKSPGKKKNTDWEVTNVECPRSPKPAHKVRPNECADFLERKCVIHLQAKHKMKDCFKLDSLADVLASAKGTGPSKKSKDRGAGF